MATAQVLRATHTIEERVRGVADTLLGVDDRGARIEDGVTSVDNRVAGVDERVVGVGSRLAGVDNKLDQVKSSLSPSVINAICDVLSSFQGINCGRTFTNGYPHQIHLRTIISHVVPITKEQRPGSSKEPSSRNGCPRVRFFGFMVNVHLSCFPPNALR